MNTIFIIIKREYLVRVRKKSFIIMTILGPLLITAFYGVIGWAAISSINQKKIAVVDDSGLFKGKFKQTKESAYAYPKESLDVAKKSFVKQGYDVLVYIPKDVIEQPKTVRIFAEKSVSLDVQNNVERAISREIETIKLNRAGITQQVIEDAKVNVDAQTISLSEEGEKNSSSVATSIIGGACAVMIYIMMLIYGTQVMRGVMEEKTNRIIEVIISSVKPFQLMLGKIIGVALVGLTQFLLWIVLTVGLLTIGSSMLGKSPKETAQSAVTSRVGNVPTMSASDREAMERKMAAADGPAANIMAAIDTLNLPLIISCFMFYFLGGYLLYSALFGAIGAAVDNETETQQFMFPIMLPIIASIAFAQFVVRDPDGPLAFWTSMIPFTSPVIMMVRIPFGVPGWQLALSMVLLVLGFLGTIWLAARIYRVGILMYGKKITYKELSKWVFYKG
ncbi:ABC transporter permease [Spirosoma rhododendri]|uniref:ABC transporter permease n=1 Tax=Spirosoma rhododendri TaxID=2728024 RepID=A0A7L5DRR4_9BACT|nr:ABC transporter permease [Spirosoma rhododendri]QJD79933.1 ABC transporter permease [Spirosoma rhododendri]